MNKIPTLFKRDPEDMRRVLPEVTPGCEWVLDGEGEATRKYDGTCVLLGADGRWWARREVKKPPPWPSDYHPISTDENTGKTVGWEPIERSPFAKFHAEAVAGLEHPDPGTYELCGPKINKNPEGFAGHVLIRHADAAVVHGNDPEQMIDYCRARGWEGVVWRHPDGQMAKLKVRDF